MCISHCIHCIVRIVTTPNNNRIEWCSPVCVKTYQNGVIKSRNVCVCVYCVLTSNEVNDFCTETIENQWELVSGRILQINIERERGNFGQRYVGYQNTMRVKMLRALILSSVHSSIRKQCTLCAISCAFIVPIANVSWIITYLMVFLLTMWRVGVMTIAKVTVWFPEKTANEWNNCFIECGVFSFCVAHFNHRNDSCVMF